MNRRTVFLLLTVLSVNAAPARQSHSRFTKAVVAGAMFFSHSAGSVRMQPNLGKDLAQDVKMHSSLGEMQSVADLAQRPSTTRAPRPEEPIREPVRVELGAEVGIGRIPIRGGIPITGGQRMREQDLSDTDSTEASSLADLAQRPRTTRAPEEIREPIRVELGAEVGIGRIPIRGGIPITGEQRMREQDLSDTDSTAASSLADLAQRPSTTRAPRPEEPTRVKVNLDAEVDADMPPTRYGQRMREQELSETTPEPSSLAEWSLWKTTTLDTRRRVRRGAESDEAGAVNFTEVNSSVDGSIDRPVNVVVSVSVGDPKKRAITKNRPGIVGGSSTVLLEANEQPEPIDPFGPFGPSDDALEQSLAHLAPELNHQMALLEQQWASCPTADDVKRITEQLKQVRENTTRAIAEAWAQAKAYVAWNIAMEEREACRQRLASDIAAKILAGQRLNVLDLMGGCSRFHLRIVPFFAKLARAPAAVTKSVIRRILLCRDSAAEMMGIEDDAPVSDCAQTAFRKGFEAKAINITALFLPECSDDTWGTKIRSKIENVFDAARVASVMMQCMMFGRSNADMEEASKR